MVSLSSIWESVTDTAESLGGAYIAPLGAVWDLGTSVFDGEDDNFGTYLGMVAKRAGDMIDPLTNNSTLTGFGFNGLMRGLEWEYDKRMHVLVRWPGTMLGHVAYDPVENWDDIFSGKKWGEAFDVAKTRSTGQTAALTALSAGRGLVSDETNQRIAEAMHNTGTWSNMDWAAVGMMDPLDKRAWEKTHENSPFLTSMMSGTSDFAARWYLDPGILIAKGAKALHTAKTGRKIATSDAQKGIRKMLDDEHYAAYGSRPFRFDPDNLATRTEHYLQWLDTGADGGRMNATQIWVGTPELRSSGAGKQIAGLLEQAGKISDDAVRRDVQRHILAVSYGDTASMFATKSDLAEFNRINDELKNIVKGDVLDLKSSALGQQIAANPELMAHLEGQLDDIPTVVKAIDNHINRLEALVGKADDLTDDAAATLDDAGIFGSLTKAPRVSAKGKRAVARESGHGLLRDGKASTGHSKLDGRLTEAAEQAQRIARHPAFSTVFQSSPNSVPLRIITTPLQTSAHLAGKFAAGYVRAPQRMMDALRTPHLQGVVNLHDWNGATTQLDSMMKGAFLAPGLRMELLSRAQMARTESAKMNAIEAIERESVASIAKHYAAKLGEKIDNDFIRVLFEHGNAKRASHLAPRQGRIYAATINDMDPFRAANEAKIDQAAHTWRVDEVPVHKGRIVNLDEEHIPTAMPLLDTQLANIVPLVDTALIKKALSREAGWLARHSRAWSQLRFEADAIQRAKAAVGDRTQKVLGTGVRAGDPERHLMSLYSAMDWIVQAATVGLRAWKFGVLFRLGYPLRVVADDQLRIWSQIGAMAVMAPLREEWMQNFRYNQHTRRAMVAQERAALRTEREQLLDVTDEAAAAAWRDRDAQIKTLNRRIGGLEAAGRRAGTRISKARIWPQNGDPSEIDVVDSRYFTEEYLPRIFKTATRSDHYANGLEIYNPRIHGGLPGKPQGFHEGPPVLAVMKEEVPGFPGTRRWTGKTKPIKRVYRSMTEEEWAEAQARGYIQSDGRGALFPDWEGTNAGIDPGTAFAYMPRNGNGIIVELQVRKADGWFTSDADSYLRTRSQIPLDRVTKKTRMFGMREGHVLPPETWTTTASAQAKAAELREARDVLQAMQGMNPDAAAKRISEIEYLLTQSSRAMRKQHRKKRIGEKPIVLQDGTVYNGAFQGEQGDAFRGITSSGQTWDNNMRVGEESAYRNVVNDGNWQVVMPTNEPAHLTAWADVLNNQFRQSPVAMHFINGGTAEEFVLWLKEPAQRTLRKRLGHYAHNPEDWAGRVEQLVTNYLGTEAIRTAVKAGRVTPAMLRKLWPDQTTRPAVHGATVAHNLGTSAFALGVGKALDRSMSWLAVQPTDRLSRHPYFAAVYKAEVTALHNKVMAGAPEGAMFTAADFRRIEAAARRNALASLKRTLFDIEAHSNAAHVMRFLSPFFAAHQEAVSRWWNIVSAKPEIARRAVQMFDMPKKLHLVVDRDGEQVPDGTMPGPGQYLLVQWPEDWGGMEMDPEDPDFRGYSDWAISLNSFNFVLQNGSPLNPGAGPGLQVPVEALVNKYTEQEDIERVARMLNPFAPGSTGDMILPAWVRRAVTLWRGEKSDEFVRMWNNNIQDRIIAFREKNGYREPTKAEKAAIFRAAKDETQMEAWIRLGQNALSPFPANPRSRFEVIRGGYQKLWEQAQAEGHDYDWVVAQFKAKYGDAYLPLMQSTSNNVANVPITNEAVGARKRHAALLSKVDPRLHGAVIAPEAGDESDYSQGAANYFRDTPMAPGESGTYLSYDDPATAFGEGAVKRGWARYSEAMDTLVAVATDAGLDTWRDSDYLKSVRKQMVANLMEENPWWAVEYRQFGDEDYVTVLEDLRTIANDKTLNGDIARGDIKTLQQYLELRDLFTEALRIRAERGGASTMEAEANADLATLYRHYFGRLEESNTYFQRYFVNGIIDRDPYLVEAD